MYKLLIKNIVKKLPFIKSCYDDLKSLCITYDVPEITKINIRASKERSPLRLNLLIPSVNKEHAFGGINTALNLFEDLRKNMNCMSRVICTDAEIGKDNILPKEYIIADAEKENNYNLQAVSFADRYGKQLVVGKNDIFVATAWWTAYNVKIMVKDQAKIFCCNPKPFVYIIQDFEPGFYPWSTKYMLADSTYKDGSGIFALINSCQLGEYLEQNKYVFQNSWVFDPVFNPMLRDIISKSEKIVKKEKKILIYGRPSVARNAFEMIIEGLRIWSGKCKDNSEWRILSAGELHNDIILHNNVMIKSVGKLTLEEYARLLRETYVGISLMISPHPSYPPLEMSVFGIKTITNTCYNKDLSTFNNNIVSLKQCTPDSIADALEDICCNFDGNGEILVDSEFVQRDSSNMCILNELSDEIKRVI